MAKRLPAVCLECYLLGTFLGYFFVALHIPQLGVIYLKMTKAMPPSCTVILLNRSFVIKGSVSLWTVASVPFPPQCLFVLNNLNWFGWRFGEVQFIFVLCSHWLCSFARTLKSCGVFCDISWVNSIWPAFLHLIFRWLVMCVFSNRNHNLKKTILQADPDR